MSHLKERAAKNCLNCNAEVQGRFCHVCGQENIEPKESVWHLVSHFFNDITHFDGKFFSTIRFLILKPGWLSKEYLIGRRASYLNPVRLYIFTSALFFLIFFLVKQKDWEGGNEKMVAAQHPFAQVKKDSVHATHTADTAQLKKKEEADIQINTDNAGDLFNVITDEYESLAAYDSAQLHAPIGEKDNWLIQKLHQRQYALNDKYHHNKEAINEAYKHELLHNFPKVFFLSLPFFALFLKLLYSRRKQFYYVNHLIFSIHFYCAIFILILLNMGLNGLHQLSHFKIFNWLSILLILSMFFFEYKSIRNFYRQSRIKSVFKMLFLNLFTFFIIFLLLIALLIFSAFQI